MTKAELIDKIAPGGRMVIPVGVGIQELYLVSKDSDGRLKKHVLYHVRFVPMQHS